MLTNSQLLDLYYWLQLSRILEDRLLSLCKSGKIPGTVYPCRGQEAISIGVACALDQNDVIAPLHRNLGCLLFRGISPAEIIANHMGRTTGEHRGKDGHLNIGDLRRGIIASLDIIGAIVPVIAGAALALKMQKRGCIALTFIGDGGTSTTDFHEGLNLAAVQRAPMVLVLENNGWAFSTPTEKQTRNTAFIERAAAYGISGLEVDGNDLLAVRDVTAKAKELAQAGNGPVLIEATTLRMRGFSQDDTGWYMPKATILEWKAKDPIRRFEEYLTAKGILIEVEKQSIVRRAMSEIDRATRDAENRPWPMPSEVMDGIYHRPAHEPN